MSVQDSKRTAWGTRETIEFQKLRIEALENELNSVRLKLEVAHRFMEELAKKMEVDYEQVK